MNINYITNILRFIFLYIYIASKVRTLHNRRKKNGTQENYTESHRVYSQRGLNNILRDRPAKESRSSVLVLIFIQKFVEPRAIFRHRVWNINFPSWLFPSLHVSYNLTLQHLSDSHRSTLIPSPRASSLRPSNIKLSIRTQLLD